MIALAVGLMATLLATLLAAAAAYGTARSWLNRLVFLPPMIVPNIVIAVALFCVFAQPCLIATNLGIALGHTLTALPIIFVILLTTFRVMDWRLPRAAATLGASCWQQVRLILPLLVKGGTITKASC
ncbi:ABC transporter permease subunit [Oceanicola sp. S124]|uniref:ABC transporter permease subunit n=1 Tax=Oceanicola sp. S124 TaxID=1042378 RepID=UPI0002FA7524|nr:ABC transporter permease subunit [Oceanicola sp. S124]